MIFGNMDGVYVKGLVRMEFGLLVEVLVDICIVGFFFQYYEYTDYCYFVSFCIFVI